MRINLKATNIELTLAIQDYVDKKIGGLEKFLDDYNDPSVQVWVEMGMSSRHHHKGDIFRAEIQIHLPHYKKGARAVAEGETLYAAIDNVHEEIKLELSKIKDRRKSLIKKGARLFKKFLPFLGE
ncbi:MAG: ribosome-associated translation inhibitor RaiA [Candidatus Terrybacteria bacterium]|nr:ribosome-associated translation inhibitor RaiA [Candidatus Terrybacteria bacterium]